VSDLVHSSLLLAVELAVFAYGLWLSQRYTVCSSQRTNSILFEEVPDFVARVQKVIVSDVRVVVGRETRLPMPVPASEYQRF
jgi:hypothetical protein